MVKKIILFLILVGSLYAFTESNLTKKIITNGYNDIHYFNPKNNSITINFTNCVTLNNDELKLLQCKTDDGPTAIIDLPKIDLDSALVIKREVYIHPEYSRSYQGGDIFFTGALSLFSGDNAIFKIVYSKYEYQCNCNFFWINNKSNQVKPIWNKWFLEKIIYFPKNGKLQYLINNKLFLTIDTKRIDNGESIRVKMATYGWWTGHYTKMKNFSIYQL